MHTRVYVQLISGEDAWCRGKPVIAAAQPRFTQGGFERTAYKPSHAQVGQQAPRACVCSVSGSCRSHRGLHAGVPDLAFPLAQQLFTAQGELPEQHGANEYTAALAIHLLAAKWCRDIFPLCYLWRSMFVQWMTSVTMSQSSSRRLGQFGFLSICMPSHPNSGLLCSPNCSLASFLAKGVRASC